MNNIKAFTRKHVGLLIASTLLLMTSNVSFSQRQTNQTPQDVKEKWTIRYSRSVAQGSFTAATSQDGFTFKTSKVNAETENVYVYCCLGLEGPVKSLTFNYKIAGDATLMPITLLDAAANELWRFDGRGMPPEVVTLKDLKVRGQIIFRIGTHKSVELPEGWSHAISDLKLTLDDQKSILDKDGFILVDNMAEFRGYAGEDNVKVRLKEGPYQIDKAFCTRFIEFTGNHSYYDLTGVRFMVDTRLFTQVGLAIGRGSSNLYCAMELSGNRTTLEGLYIETYGDHPGRQSKNKIFNIIGSNVTLKNTAVRTAGSMPYGYGSFYGLGGRDVRKMNGIRVGWPAKDVKLVGCRVHMRAMGHAIFLQGAENTLVEDCHVDGLLRTTDDILAETSGYAFDREFKAGKGGYIEGATVADDGTFLPGEMFSLSEDGIRMYPKMGQNYLTGSTIIRNCTVTNMRRGICTGLSSAGDKVINCQVNNCVAAGFNVGNADTLINCRADAKYAEALCLAYTNAMNAEVDVEILDSRGGMKNSLLAKINGMGHQVTLRTANPSFIPDDMTIELSTTKGYGGPRRGASARAVNIQLVNQTPAKVVLLPGTLESQIKSVGTVEDRANEE